MGADDPPRRGFTVLDGIAFVTGAAIASVHVRGPLLDGTEGTSWAFVAAVFGGLAVTASGPFVLLEHRLFSGGQGRPKLGEGLWAGLGLPWAIGAVLRTFAPRRGLDAIDFLIALGVGVACLVALGVVWKTWVAVRPPPDAPPAPAEPWTEYVGLTLAIAWPVQCGLGLILLGNR